jgi:hypothetical protein
MGSLLFYVAEVLVLAVLVVFITNSKFRTTNDSSLPPGPPAEPLIGHARLLPREGQAEFYEGQSGKILSEPSERVLLRGLTKFDLFRAQS